MARKRAHNEGWIYFRKERNEWCAQISLNGKRLTRYWKTQRECRDWVWTKLKPVQLRAGHTKASTTSDVYGYSTNRSQEEAAQRIKKMVLPFAVNLLSKESCDSARGAEPPDLLV